MAKVIMVQGTMSSAGKSFVAAGLCRVLAQDGWRVAPFKSQNMALNSYVTREGLEMGRAQVMQAEAAGIEPSVDMNPILLKPTSDVGSQVIVNGIARGNMDARDYFQYKKQLIPDIKAAFRRLSAKADIIVVEGAGSPAEINLRENDIVNMGLAQLLGAPVLLVGDIDRGGVFAQLVGTVELLEKEERARVKGFVINKFRGDPSLLTSGIDMLTARTGIPTVGILPYLHVSLDDEDSLSSRLENKIGGSRTDPDGGRGLGSRLENKTTEGRIDPDDEESLGSPLENNGKAAADTDVILAVIRLPHISNFTDFDVFDMFADCQVRYVTAPAALAGADMVVLPGTKNTVDDLRWLWRSGMAEAIRAYAAAGKPVWGICGGYQMLGMTVADPNHYETKAGEDRAEVKGLCLLPVRTILTGTKTLVRVEGVFLHTAENSRKIPGSDVPGAVSASQHTVFAGLSGMSFQGYEIHMGLTETIEERERHKDDGKTGEPFIFIKTEEGQRQDRAGLPRKAGWVCQNVGGSYVHGIFDADGVAAKVIGTLRQQKRAAGSGRQDMGLSEAQGSLGGVRDKAGEPRSYRHFKEAQYDILADMIRRNMDMAAVYDCLQEAKI